ncbi:hypothetical protein ILUMI_17512, partial [Ignelater luminosus]
KLLAKILSDQQTPLGVGVAKVIADYLRELQNPKKRNATTKRRKFNVIPGKSTAFHDSPKKVIVKTTCHQRAKHKQRKEEFSKKAKKVWRQRLMQAKKEEKHLHPNGLETNFWIIVEYQTKNTIKHYVGKVIAINNEEANIKFLKRSKSGKFKWPNVEGEDTISINNIKKRLGVPKVCQRDKRLRSVQTTEVEDAVLARIEKGPSRSTQKNLWFTDDLFGK